MTMLQHGLVPSTGGYQIERSLRFNSADSAYLNRTPASTGSKTIWTYSAWVKYSVIDNGVYAQPLFWASETPSVFGGVYFIQSPNTPHRIYVYNGSNEIETTQVFRDPSAWYHIVAVIDNTQATASNRTKLYVNGVQVTALATANYPSQNAASGVNGTTEHNIGKQVGQSRYLDGYLTEVHFIDGSAKTPSDFGETDTDTGVWKPKAYSGSYGTNGFYLKFADNSGTTSTTLGKDSSGNGNNWTPNNFSVTAGAGNDSLVDTPTPYGTDTGAGGEVRGNYCTLSPTYALNVTYNTPTNGNLEVALSNNSTAYGTFSFTTGKWYWEVTVSGAGSAGFGYIGVMDSTFIKTDNTWSSQARTYIDTGSKYGGSSSSYGASWTNGDVIGVAVDMDAGTIVFYKNGSSQGTAFSDLAGKEWKPLVYATTATYNMNFGQRPFAYTAPSGFKALCTQNLPTPTIGATSTTQAGKYFNTVIWTGNASSPRSITGVGFQPDFVWVKSRSNTYNHDLFDVIRGGSLRLSTNATDAEYNLQTGGYDYISSFNSDGFTATSAGTPLNLNGNNVTFAAWNWKAGGSGVSNTQGTITSTVSANTEAGFSIVRFTGSSSASPATVGHGLGAVPQFIITKPASEAGIGWFSYHASLGRDYYFLLDNTVGASNYANYWGSSAFTSSVFGVLAGGSAGNNRSGQTMICYCFAPVAGYSAFGSYTGNGSTDGPFVFTGFRPAFVMFKSSDAVNAWLILDKTRNTYNLVNSRLFPNQSSAEDSASGIDLLSNGFKLRSTSALNNDNGITYVYAAFAEVPQKFSLAR